MLGEVWRALVRKYIVYDVPEEMAACFDCNVVQCTNDRYESRCYRLTYAAALKPARTNTTSVANVAEIDG